MFLKVLKIFSCLYSLFVLSLVTTANASELQLAGNFKIETISNGIQIHPQVVADNDVDIRYKLTVSKCGTAGTSKHVNSGRIHLEAGKKKNIGGTISFQHFSDHDHVSMTLQLYKNKELMMEVSKEYPSSTSCES